MTLQELRYLVAIAEHRHFGRAAEACNVTQPTLSAQVRKLEAYLGMTLIDRTSRQPVPTPIGAQIVERAHRLLAEADEILLLTRQRRGPLQGALNVGLIPTLAPYFLPWLLAELRIRYPRMHLVVHEDTTRRLEDKLAERLLDAAFLALPAVVPGGDLTECALFDEPFFVACPLHHPIAAEETVSSERLIDLPLMLLTEGHCLRGQALAACGQNEASQDDAADCRATSLETLRQLVTAGLGCTLLPALAVRHLDHGDMVVRPLASRECRRIGLVWPSTHAKANELQRLASSLKEVVPPGAQPLR